MTSVTAVTVRASRPRTTAREAVPTLACSDRKRRSRRERETEIKARAFVRIHCSSHADAKELALRLQADGYRVTRRWKLVIAGADTPEGAACLARKLLAGAPLDGSQPAKRRWSRVGVAGSD